MSINPKASKPVKTISAIKKLNNETEKKKPPAMHAHKQSHNFKRLIDDITAKPTWSGKDPAHSFLHKSEATPADTQKKRDKGGQKTLASSGSGILKARVNGGSSKAIPVSNTQTAKKKQYHQKAHTHKLQSKSDNIFAQSHG